MVLNAADPSRKGYLSGLKYETSVQNGLKYTKVKFFQTPPPSVAFLLEFIPGNCVSVDADK